MLQSVSNIGHQEANLIAAIVSRTVKFETIERLFRHELDHRIGDLNFTSGAAALLLDLFEYLRLQNVTAGNYQVRGRRLALRLFDHAGDLEGLTDAAADANGAVAVNLLVWNFLDGDDVAAGFFVDFHHLLEAAWLRVNQHVGKQQGERLVSDQRARAPNSMPQPEGLLLSGETHLTGAWQIRFEQVELGRFSAPAQSVFKLVLLVEMIFDNRLVASGDENEMLDTRFPRFIDSQLDDRTVNNGQHFLGHGLGGGQKTGAKPSNRKHGLLNCGFHGIV